MVKARNDLQERLVREKIHHKQGGSRLLGRGSGCLKMAACWNPGSVFNLET